ncbi:NADH-quinone oxidoreductase subunit NuoK [Enterobacteriaceae endosymbiont of Macroplea mutica]|uniref:NADH-quinone oxidoreductase subunit NuoK n=1 Tax=Enterobacteriaceae endosymbiont of Macroplea mutica TaxID=2675791 RepID=UPI00144984AD|nr:NADH-quinone oxidoreductase subunit NuoK [Enterobacteriaceae endosymbiont of Macroplea mutica]QJC31375.1 NADH-quinone oxidoreductase subunit NuoK [Enterobacteriaceae endosymbiont of Macroplea mutica]
MISLYYILVILLIIFIISFTGLIIRQHILYILILTEIMLNIAAFTCIIAGNYWQQIEGEIMYILSISISAIESCIGLTLLMLLYYRKHTMNINSISELNG